MAARKGLLSFSVVNSGLCFSGHGMSLVLFSPIFVLFFVLVHVALSMSCGATHMNCCCNIEVLGLVE